MTKLLFSTARLGTLLDLLDKHPKVVVYTAFPIARITGVVKKDKKGNITLATEIGTISTNVNQTGHFIKVPDEMELALSSVADPSYLARIQRFEQGQGLTWND